MNQKSSIKKNYIFNVSYNVLTLIVPLIVTPYISRVLCASGVGQYSYSFSIVTYFTLLGSWGFNYYGQRLIAENQNDKHKQSIIFWEIFLARLITVSTVLVIYFILVLTNCFGATYSLILQLLSIQIASIAFDAAFFYQGNEEFKLLTIRSFIVKILGVACIFIFVKKENDVWIYTLCQSLTLFVSALTLWPFVFKRIERISLRELHIKKHFVPTLRLFIPTIASTAYTMADKTLIGFLVPGTTEINGVEKSIADLENGYYEQSEKIAKLCLTLITSLSAVMLPRNSQLISEKRNDEFIDNIHKALRFVLFLGIPMMFGIAAISYSFCPWFLGPGYDKSPLLLIMFSPLILIIGLSNLIGVQYLLPMKQDTKYIIAFVVGAAINVTLDVVLIIYFTSVGACIATVASELILLIMMLFFSRKDISLIMLMKDSWKYFLSGSIMFAGVFTLSFFLQPKPLFTITLIVVGVFIYLFLLFLLRDSMLFSLCARIKKITSTIFRKRR